MSKINIKYPTIEEYKIMEIIDRKEAYDEIERLRLICLKQQRIMNQVSKLAEQNLKASQEFKKQLHKQQANLSKKK